MKDSRTVLVARVLLIALVASLAILGADLLRAENPLTATAWRTESWWRFDGLHRPGDDIEAVIGRLPVVPEWYPLYVSLSVGTAAREAAGGPVRLMLSSNTDTFTVEGPDGAPVPLSLSYLKAFSRGELLRQDYDHELTDNETVTIERRYELLRYPWGVTAVIGSDDLAIVETSKGLLVLTAKAVADSPLEGR